MLCLAAIHRGVISDKGGEIKLRIEKGLKQYKGIE
jgi:hypothetical protein